MAQNTPNTFVILDGHAIIHRAYHAIPPLKTKDGRVVNAVYGFASILLRVLKELSPTHIAVTFDLAGPTFRHEQYEDYKATREKADDELYEQIPLIYDLVNAFNITIYEKEGFEADDCIGTLVKKVRKEKDATNTIIVTGDMDALQLVDDHVVVNTMRKGMSDLVMYDRAAVQERYHGLTPEQVIDYKALKGDSSDNIPGVRGIGDKGATELLLVFPTLDDIYYAAEQEDERIKPALRKKLLAGKEDAYLSQELATIHQDVPIMFSLKTVARQPVDEDALLRLFQEFEFTSLLSRIPGMKHKVTAQVATAPECVEITQKTLADAIAAIVSVKHVGFVLDVSLGNFLDVTLCGVLIVSQKNSWYVSTQVKGWEKVLTTSAHYIGHNIKESLKVFWQCGLQEPKHLFDIMVGSYLIHSESRAHDLPALALKYLGTKIAKDDKQASLFGKPKEQLVQEAHAILNIATHIKKEVQEDLQQLYNDIEGPLIEVLARMEMAGVALDDSVLKTLAKSTDSRLDKLTKAIYKDANQEFNINSSSQLREVLFDGLGLPTDGIKKGKTGYSTAASELEKLREFHPIIAKIEEYRELMKLKTTYIDVLPTLVHPKSHRIHSTFNQTVAATGRLSSSDPNMQNIPIRTQEGRKIRDAFVAGKGKTLVVADYSQIELRIVASLAKDKAMMKIFNKGEDIHQSTAAKIHDVPLDQVTHDMRRSAKEVNFGVLYGMGSFGLASRTGISRAQAQEFIDKYFEAFSGVKQYLDKTITHAKKHGYVETLFGRRRYIPEIATGNFQLRAAAERMAINHPIQGTAADLMKLAMIALDRKSKDDDDITMILQVHDELVFEVKTAKAKAFAKVVEQQMRDVLQLAVPIEVHTGIGKSWGQAK